MDYFAPLVCLLSVGSATFCMGMAYRPPANMRQGPVQEAHDCASPTARVRSDKRS